MLFRSFDAISGPDTLQIAYDVLPPSGGQLATVQTGSIGNTTPGKTVTMVRVQVMRELLEHSEGVSLLYRKLHSLLNEGAIKVRFFLLFRCLRRIF